MLLLGMERERIRALTALPPFARCESARDASSVLSDLIGRMPCLCTACIGSSRVALLQLGQGDRELRIDPAYRVCVEATVRRGAAVDIWSSPEFEGGCPYAGVGAVSGL